MKKQKFLKVSALLTAICLAASLAGCGGTQNPSSSSGSVASAPTGDGPLTAYEETLTLNTVRSENANVTFVDGESFSDNFVSRLFKDKLNVVWNATWSSDPAAYTAKLNLDIAGDDLPDAFFVNALQLNTMIASGQIMDLTSVYQAYASDKLKANVESNGGLALKGCTVNGKMYGIPAMTSQESDVAIMWVRQDWVDELKLTIPTTYEELVAFATAIKNAKVSSGGSGFDFYGPGSLSFDTIAQTAGAYYNIWTEDANGKLVYSNIQPEMKAALQRMQDLYKAGIIESDFAVKGTTEQELISIGQYGIVFGQYFYPHLLKGSVLNDSTAEWRAYPIPKNDSGKVVPKSSTNVGGYYVVRNGYEHPEALLKTMNLWMEIWSEDGEYRDWFTETIMSDKYKNVYLCGEYALPSFFDVYDNNVRIGEGIRNAFAGGDPATAIKNESSLAQFSYSFMADETAANFISGEGWALKHVYLYGEDVYQKYDQFQYNAWQGALSEDGTFLQTTLDKMTLEVFLDIIMGGDINKFDTYVTDWLAQGGQDLTDEVNAWYEASK